MVQLDTRMKILKFFITILVIITLIFVIRGLMTSSISYSSEITVDKPVSEAWAVMQDESKITEWLQGITDIKHISGEKGKVGAVTEYTFSQAGQESTVVETIKSITPEQQITMDFSSPGAMDMAYTVDFTADGSKTVIKSSTDVSGQGFFMKCLIPWLHGTMVSQEDLNMSNLQKLINANTTNYFPEPVNEMLIQ